MHLMVGLTDGAWAALSSMVASLVTLIAVLFGNRKATVIDKKVTPPNGDPRTIAQIISDAHPETSDTTTTPPK